MFQVFSTSFLPDFPWFFRDLPPAFSQQEQCGFASLEELDPPTAEQLAKSRGLGVWKFGSIHIYPQ